VGITAFGNTALPEMQRQVVEVHDGTSHLGGTDLGPKLMGGGVAGGWMGDPLALHACRW
ncbi:hypothetical protein (partial), partial [Bordetella avium 197N]